MTPALGALARCGAHLGLALLIGSTVLLLLAGPSPDPGLARWRGKLSRSATLAALLFLLASALGLLAQAAIILEQPLGQVARQPALLRDFVVSTQLGQVWQLRMLAGLVLLLLALVPARGGLAALRAAGILLAAAAAVVAAGWAGHAADAGTPYLLLVQVAHVLAVCLWVGALPGWIALVRRVGTAPDAARCAYVAKTLRRFSRLATVCVAVILASGLWLALSFIKTQGDLLGTRYGGLVCAKLAGLLAALALADRVRRGFLAQAQVSDRADVLYRQASRLVGAELALAASVLLLASALAQTTPASHAQPQWWLPFRISLAATWPIWYTPTGPYALAAAALVALAAAAWLARNRRRRSLRTRLQVGAACTAAIVALLAWPLAVPAYPDTYRRSDVAYLSVSIAHGQALYEAHCVACHGSGGLGDGPAGRGLPRPPANLSQPHTALHTAGDLYWWLGHGIPRSRMPAFGDVLSEEDRWDLVNFLRAFSQGFQGRILSPQVAPLAPWLGAPDFYYEAADGAPHELKDFRGGSAVLLVFLAGGDTGVMVERLARMVAAARWPALSVLAVNGAAPASGAEPYTLIGSGADEIRGTYELLSRTAGNRGDPQRVGLPRGGMAFLIDRYGYIRARWIPEEETEGWADVESLRTQVAALNAEPQLLPPPDEHVH